MGAVMGPNRAGVAPVPNAPVQIGGLDSNGLLTAVVVNADGTVSRGNSTNATIYASTPRTGDPTVVDQTNVSGSGVVVVIDCTAVVSSPSVVFTIQGKDNLGIVYPILVSAAIVGTGTTVLRVYPNLTAAANTKATDILPRTWNIKAVHGNANSITYSVTASVIP